MKTLAALVIAFAATVLTNVETASAQQGSSYSWSNSSSYSWSSSWGSGPGGYYNNFNSNRSQQSTWSQSTYGVNPYTGGYYNNGSSRTTGYNSNYGWNRGFNANGAYGGNYGGYNSYSRGNRWNWG